MEVEIEIESKASDPTPHRRLPSTASHMCLLCGPYAVVAGLDCAWSCMVACLLSELTVHVSFCLRGVERGDA